MKSSKLHLLFMNVDGCDSRIAAVWFACIAVRRVECSTGHKALEASGHKSSPQQCVACASTHGVTQSSGEQLSAGTLQTEPFNCRCRITPRSAADSLSTRLWGGGGITGRRQSTIFHHSSRCGQQLTASPPRCELLICILHSLYILFCTRHMIVNASRPLADCPLVGLPLFSTFSVVRATVRGTKASPWNEMGHYASYRLIG